MSSKRKTSSMPAVAMDEGDGHASKKRKLPVCVMLLLLLWCVRIALFFEWYEL